MKKGRRLKSDSRAAELRVRLVAWRQEPEATRVTLRALAEELGTSHQLLSFYLRGLDDWLMAESRRKVQELRNRMESGESTNIIEDTRRLAELEAEMKLCHWDHLLDYAYRRYERDASRAPLNPKMEEELLRLGDPRGRRIVALSRAHRVGDKVKSAFSRIAKASDSDKVLQLINSLSRDEREQLWVLLEASRRTSEELRNRISRALGYSRVEILPLSIAGGAKSFGI